MTPPACLLGICCLLWITTGFCAAVVVPAPFLFFLLVICVFGTIVAGKGLYDAGLRAGVKRGIRAGTKRPR